MKVYKYAAFISYRHIEPDKTIAKKLHTMIETYGIPGAVKRSSGKKKMGRVFRDEEELPLSSDLGGDITKALEESEWLIVICSPKLLKSLWCMKEIDTFIELGRKDHILTVLTRGEPDDSFPPQLRFDEIDGELIEKEPLAADVRGKSIGEMLKRLKGEKLRLLAPMLGVTYDDLRQRARERRLKTVLAATLASLVLVGGFLAYAVSQNRVITQQKDEITVQRDEIATQRDIITEERNSALESQSRYLADASLRAENDGDHSLAMLLALYALPNDPLAPNRPVVDEASSALYQLLLSESGLSADAGYASVSIIKTENEILDYVVTSDDSENRIARVYTDELGDYIQDYSLATGSRVKGFNNELFTMRPDNVELTRSGAANAYYYGDRVDFIRAGDNKIYSAALPEKDPADRDYGWTMGESRPYWSLDYELYHPIHYTGDMNAQLLIGSEPFRIDEMSWIGYAVPGAGRYDPIYLLGGLGRYDAPDLILWDAKTRQTLRTYETPDTVHGLASSADGRYYLASCHSFDHDRQKDVGTLIFGEVNTGKVILSMPNDALDGSVATGIAFTSDTSKPYFSVVTDDGSLMVYDYSAMEWLFSCRPAVGRVLSAHWSDTNDRLVAACSDDVARVIGVYGQIECELPCADKLEDAIFDRDDAAIILESFKSLQVYAVASADPAMSIVTSIVEPLNSDAFNCAFSPDSSIMALRYSNGLMLVLESATGEVIYSDDAGVGNVPSYYVSYSDMISFSPDGSLLIYPISDSNSKYEDTPTTLRVVDTASWQIVHEFAPTLEYAPGTTAYLNSLCMRFSADGGYLAVWSQSGTVATYLYDTQTWVPALLRAYSDKLDESYAQVQTYAGYKDVDFNVMFNERNELVLLTSFAHDYDDIVGGAAKIEVFNVETRELLSSANIERFDRIAMKADGSAICYTQGKRLFVCAADGGELFSCELANAADENGLRFSTTDGFICCTCAGSRLLVDYVNGTSEYITGSLLTWNRYDLAALSTNEENRVSFDETVNQNGYLNDNSRFEIPFNNAAMYLYRNQLIDAATGKAFVTLGGGHEDANIMAVSADGLKLCYYINREFVTRILCLPELTEAIRMGRDRLNGRELTETEMRKYFITQ